jgi:hypothetical protein
MEVRERYERADPVEVAHDFLTHENSKEWFPSALEEYRKYEDHELYKEWLRDQQGRRRRTYVPMAPTPKWDPATRTLTFFGKVYRKYKRNARNQFELLATFEKQSWPEVVTNPFTQHERLSQTIKDINRYMIYSAELSFFQDGARAGWRCDTAVDRR